MIQGIVGHELAALDCLKERVVKFSRQACAFGQSLVETSADTARNLAHPQPVDGPHNKETGDYAKE
jgi:hypothetical protein